MALAYKSFFFFFFKQTSTLCNPGWSPNLLCWVTQAMLALNSSSLSTWAALGALHLSLHAGSSPHIRQAGYQLAYTLSS